MQPEICHNQSRLWHGGWVGRWILYTLLTVFCIYRFSLALLLSETVQTRHCSIHTWCQASWLYILNTETSLWSSGWLWETPSCWEKDMLKSWCGMWELRVERIAIIVCSRGGYRQVAERWSQMYLLCLHAKRIHIFHLTMMIPCKPWTPVL